MKEKQIQVLIVEDQDLTSQLFKTFLEGTNRYRVTAILQNAQMAPVYCMKHPVDLILMDVYTTPQDAGDSGIRAARTIKKEHPGIRIIIMTSMPEAGYLEHAREAGADSFWYKQASRELLVEICDRTLEGESLFPTEKPQLELGLAKSSELTEREIIILREVVRGATNQEIAEKLYMSVATVKQHVAVLMQKTGFKSRTELAVRARQTGIVIPD